MKDTLKFVIETRLAELDRNPFEAARLGGLERGFLNDILVGKKKTVRSDKFAQLARALDWTRDQLTSHLEVAGRGSDARSESYLGHQKIHHADGEKSNGIDRELLRIAVEEIARKIDGFAPEMAEDLASSVLEYATKPPVGIPESHMHSIFRSRVSDAIQWIAKSKSG